MSFSPRLFLMALLVAVAIPCPAATNTALSLSYADQLTAYNACVPGDTLALPAGSAAWSANERLEITRRISITGAGTNLTTIFRGTGSNQLYWFHNLNNTATNFVASISGLKVHGGPNATAGLIAVGNFSETNRAWHVHDIYFDDLERRGFVTLGRVEGLADYLYFDAPFNANAQAVAFLGPQQAGAQTTAGNSRFPVLGTFAEKPYVENCVFAYAFPNSEAVDAYFDAEFVFRFNTITNTTFLAVHDSAPTARNATVWEFYGNTLFNNSVQNSSYSRLRSGWGVAFSNTVVSTVSMVLTNPLLTLYRASGTNIFVSWYPTISVTGTNRLDGNINTNASQYGYPGLDQPGYGNPSAFSATNSTQTLHACYSWANTYNGFDVGFKVLDFCGNPGHCNDGLTGADGTTIPEPSDLIVLGRDYFNGTPRPGYTPAPYPHPLATYVPPAPPPPVPSLPGRSLLLLR